ncbi:MAG: alpha/beta fold hydrolase [Candidatus Dadabacteria bacterium]|nr:MAG: alpha/beta fold hydrolase [Candidatus Dadabacteria bacterium]
MADKKKTETAGSPRRKATPSAGKGKKAPARKAASRQASSAKKPTARKSGGKKKSAAAKLPAPSGSDASAILPKAKRGPIIDDVDIRSLHTKEHYEVETKDGWTLVITRYKPIPQDWHQPILNVPLLLVHGFSQNRHAWTAGEFVKDMLYFGCDIHILELRGHGLSSLKLQQQKADAGIKPLPETFNYGWDLSHYFLYDVPAAIDAVKQITGRDKIAYCGHSMGGMIGYGLASQRDDLLCMATVGSPADLGAEAWWIRLAALAGGMIPLLQAIARLADDERAVLFRALRKNRFVGRWVPDALSKERLLNPEFVPMDWFLGTLYRSIATANEAIPTWIPREFRLFNPTKVALEDVRWLLKEGGEREPVRVLLTFLRWIRHREMVCYSSGYDIKANFHKIRLPLTIIFGDEDILAGMKSTRAIYEAAQSDYLVWRPVRGNSHIEITMGDDIRQIAYDIKNLIEFAITHQDDRPRLPRRAAHRRQLLRGVSRGRRRRSIR